MEQKQLDHLKGWFAAFVAGCYSQDAYVNANLKMKQDHTHRTCGEMLALADALALDPKQTRLAEAIALLHDVGRFEQFVLYRTYKDTESEDHCGLGVRVLEREGILQVLPRQEAQIIRDAVLYHGRKQLPAGLTGQQLLFAKLVRDADKLDILYVIVENDKAYHRDPAKFPLEVEFPDGPEYSRDVVDAILKGDLIDYTRLRTLNDMRLCQLGWVYDIYFAATLRRITDRGLLEQLAASLPATPDVEQVKQKIFAFVRQRIDQPA